MAEQTTKKITKKMTAAKPKKTLKTSKKEFVTSPVMESKNMTDISTAPRSLKVKRSYLLTLMVILLLLALAFLGRNLLVAAMVNGQPISRLSVIQELEKQGGKQALDTLVTETLIFQEAKKKNITVSQKEIDDEIKNIEKNLEKQGQKLDQVLALQGLSQEQLVEQIKVQKMLQKMVGKMTVSDKEVDEYITNNQESLPQDQDEKTIRTNVKNSLEQQKMNEKAQSILENLRKNAKLDYYVKY